MDLRAAGVQQVHEKKRKAYVELENKEKESKPKGVWASSDPQQAWNQIPRGIVLYAGYKQNTIKEKEKTKHRLRFGKM